MKKFFKRRAVASILCAASVFLLVSCGKSNNEAGSFKTPEVPDTSAMAAAGGSATLPPEFVIPTEAGQIAYGYTGSEMYGSFLYITTKGTEFFTTTGSITLSMNSNLKKLSKEEYVDVKTDKELSNISVALFKKDGDFSQYISTALFPADGTTYEAIFDGLDPAAEYRFMFSYTDYPRVRASSTFTATGVTTAPTPIVEEDDSTTQSKKA